MDKSALLLEKLRQRTQSSLASGGDVFVFASMLVIDVCLNARNILKMFYFEVSN